MGNEKDTFQVYDKTDWLPGKIAEMAAWCSDYIDKNFPDLGDELKERYLDGVITAMKTLGDLVNKQKKTRDMFFVAGMATGAAFLYQMIEKHAKSTLLEAFNAIKRDRSEAN